MRASGDGGVDVALLDVDAAVGRVVAAGERGQLAGLAVAPGVGVGIAVGDDVFGVTAERPAAVVDAIERAARPRWAVWSGATAATLVAEGLRVATCWDVAAAHRLLHGGFRADEPRVWAAMRGLDPRGIPPVGQLDLGGAGAGGAGAGGGGSGGGGAGGGGSGGGGGRGAGVPQPGGGAIDDPRSPVRVDGHLRPEWVGGGWADSCEHLARWAACAAWLAQEQQRALGALAVGGDASATARAESAAELLCAELSHDGLPVDVPAMEAVIGALVGPRPRDESGAAASRAARDADVLSRVAEAASGTDLRNPAHVRALLARVGVDVPDTRAWRLEPYRDAHPVVDALLAWRKAERVATTYGYGWLDRFVRGGRLRGEWTGCDGAAGRMTASAGLHNLPAELRVGIVAEPGHVFVRADLGQIEPRVLAAVSGDAALARAAHTADLYAPIATRLGVDRPAAKIAVLAAMYGQTSGDAGKALRAFEAAYPTAMRYLRDADEAGRAGRDVRTYGGRLVRMYETAYETGEVERGDDRSARAAVNARGRYARNAVVQGAAAELFKVWAVTVRARLAATEPDASIVLCLHDELLVHAPSGRGDEVMALVDACLQEAAGRWVRGGDVRFVADRSVVSRWSDAK